MTTTSGVFVAELGDGKYRIVVGQEWDYREAYGAGDRGGALTPRLIALPFMLLILLLLLHREPTVEKSGVGALPVAGMGNAARRQRRTGARFAHWSKRA